MPRLQSLRLDPPLPRTLNPPVAPHPLPAMGAFLSSPYDSVARLASPEICDDETWENTLANRSSLTVLDHLEIFSSPLASEQSADELYDPLDLVGVVHYDASLTPITMSPSASTASLSPPPSPRCGDRPRSARRLAFAPNRVRVYCIGSPPTENFELPLRRQPHDQRQHQELHQQPQQQQQQCLAQKHYEHLFQQELQFSAHPLLDF
jgi:hypothetical protein